MSVYCMLPERLRVLSVQAERSLRPSGPLLIRGFGVRVPGGAPVLTCHYRIWLSTGVDRIVDRCRTCPLPFSHGQCGKGSHRATADGSYRVRVYAGNDPLTGKEIRLKATAKTAEHAQAELARLLAG